MIHRTAAFLSLSLYDTLGLAPSVNVLFWRPSDFPVSNSNRDTSLDAWNHHSGSFMVDRLDTEILFSNLKSPSHESLMTLLPLTSYSDFPTDQTFHQFHDLDTKLDIHRIKSSFHEAFATDVACHVATLNIKITLYTVKILH